MVDVMIKYELWSTSMMPEGILERWLVKSGAVVRKGEMLAQVRIEDALHDIAAPAAGMLVTGLKPNEIFDPGTIIARIDAAT